MPRKIIRIFSCLVMTGTIATPSLGQHNQTTTIRNMIDAVSADRLSDHIRILQSAGGHWSRVNFTPGNDSAVLYVKNTFESLPTLTSVQLDTFFISDAASPYNVKPVFNVVATLLGKTEPAKEYIVGAHIDCSASRVGDSAWSQEWQTIHAPGADDNASGVAAMFELARIFTDPSFGFRNEYTIKFIAFGAEESGPAYLRALHGSTHYAAEARARGDQILGMLNLDMLGYNHQFLYSDIAANTFSEWLASSAIEINNSYSIGLTMRSPPFSTGTGSDHSSFWVAGFPAILLIENYPPWQSNAFFQANPYYHKTSDTLETLNMELVKRITQVAAGLLATVSSPTLSTTPWAGVEAAPAFFELLQNYPNPFNSTTNFRFRIVNSGNVSLNIYDVLGRNVAALVNEQMSPGVYTVRWQASDRASGVFLGELKVENFTSVKKLILVK